MLPAKAPTGPPRMAPVVAPAPTAPPYSMLVAFQARVRQDGAFVPDPGSGAGGAGDLGLQLVASCHRAESPSPAAGAWSRGRQRDRWKPQLPGRQSPIRRESATRPASKTSEATRPRKTSPFSLLTVDSPSIRRMRMLVPSGSSPGRSGRGCTMSLSGSSVGALGECRLPLCGHALLDCGHPAVGVSTVHDGNGRGRSLFLDRHDGRRGSMPGRWLGLGCIGGQDGVVRGRIRGSLVGA